MMQILIGCLIMLNNINISIYFHLKAAFAFAGILPDPPSTCFLSSGNSTGIPNSRLREFNKFQSKLVLPLFMSKPLSLASSSRIFLIALQTSVTSERISWAGFFSGSHFVSKIPELASHQSFQFRIKPWTGSQRLVNKPNAKVSQLGSCFLVISYSACASYQFIVEIKLE